MATIQTINGPKDSSELGQVLNHEHLTSGMGSFERLGYYNREDAIRRGVEALQNAYDVGIRTVIDCTPLDLGRDELLFDGIAGKTPMNVICATGVYRWVPMPYAAWDEDGAAAFMLREINDGIAGTSIKPGIIKLARDIEYQLEPLRKALLMPKVGLFIADDVGLGKTIEAGLILREMLLRQRIRRVVISCPPSVLRQWEEEMAQRFGLAFTVM
ncbi:MAG: SNF2-related protein, partial [Chloroflexota bacterium]